MSRIGKLPIILPKNIQITLEGNCLSVKGPKGTLTQKIPKEIKIVITQELIELNKIENTRIARAKYGLTRSLLQNMIIGTTLKFEKRLQMIGVGYRAQVKENELVLNVGYSHPISIKIPEDIEIKIENTNLIITGNNKEKIGILAAKIRGTRPPEPYKGKGIRYLDEILIRKAGKSGKK